MNFKKLSYVFLVLILVLFASCSSNTASDKDITAFSFPQGTGVITDTSPTVGSIAVTVPFGTAVTALVATFTTTGASVAVDGTPQVSGTTQNNFSSPVHYIVTAQDASTKDYTVTVTVAGPTVGQVVPFTANGVTFNMVYVPGGLSFLAGLNDDEGASTVNDAYWIGETEVTYELWSTVHTWAIANGYQFANVGVKGSTGTGNVTQPVVAINWRDAMVFTNALTEWYNATNFTNYTCAYYTDSGYTAPIRTATGSLTVTRSTPGSQDAPYVLSTASGFRMLLSNEWELAARYKGADSSNGAYQYPAGSGYYWTPGSYASGATADYNNALATQAVAWYSANSSETNDVKLLAPNTLGLYDMSGNVWESVFDWSGSDIRAERGGYCWNNAEFLRVGVASYDHPANYGGGHGFRIGRSDL